jgi:hypothetical protein
MAAEFAVVVLGVTLALWADDWASERSDRAEEAARLVALRANIDETIVDVRTHLDEVVEAAVHLRDIVEQSPASIDELRVRLGWGLFYGAVFSPALNVYDDLKSSGELSLLTNPELRSALATLDAGMGRIQLAQSDLSNVQQLHIDSFALNSTNMRVLYGDVVGVPWLETIDEDQLKFVEEVQFINRMLLKLDLVNELESRFRDVENTLLRVRSMIDEQLRTS